LKKVILLLFAAAVAVSSADIDVTGSVGLSYPTGKWGNSLNTGLDAGLSARWLVTRSFRAGAGLSFSVFGSGDQGAASLTFVKPRLDLAYYLRPHGSTFNPGVTGSFGFCRSSLSNSGGTDPATWDPFWSLGLRWNFSVGGGFRGEVGFDYSSIMAEQQTGDTFDLKFAFSREVSL